MEGHLTRFFVRPEMSNGEGSDISEMEEHGFGAMDARSTWTVEEDSHLTHIVEEFGARNWTFIATQVEGRTGKQCRERWRNHLVPGLRKDPFTPEEDEIILRMIDEVGSKWSLMAKALPGRTDNAIKNRYNASLRARGRPAARHKHHDIEFHSKRRRVTRAKTVSPPRLSHGEHVVDDGPDCLVNWAYVDHSHQPHVLAHDHVVKPIPRVTHAHRNRLTKLDLDLDELEASAACALSTMKESVTALDWRYLNKLLV